MSIADKITRLTNARNAIRTALINKGILASDHGFEDFAEDVGNISTGYPEPTGRKTITENGTGIDVKDYAEVNVNVPTTSENKLQKMLAGENVTLTADDFQGVTSISNYQFRDKSNLYGNFSLPDTITTIGQFAFDGCSNLALTSLPSGLTTISEYAFRYCTNLALTSLPNGLTSIMSCALQGCTNIALTSLPSGLISLGTYCLQNCKSITLTSLPNGLQTISQQALQGCTGIKITDLPSSLTLLGRGAVASMGLTTLIFHSKPTMYADSLEYNSKLTNIYVPWAENEVANAPWGATNATIHYNYTPPTE